MTFASARELLESLLRNEEPSEEALLAFLRSRASNEGLFLDFKSALELDEPAKKRNFTLRQYVSAFANSEGGVLFIGGEDKTKEVTPVTPAHEGKVGGDLAGWAARAVSDLVGYLGMPPRFVTVDVAGGKVLFVAVARAPTLVPITKEGRLTYFFRFGDETVEAPAYLISDLVLGRRQTPYLTVESDPVRVLRKTHESVRRQDDTESSRRADVLELSGMLQVSNDSLLKAQRVMAGLLTWHTLRNDQTGSPKISPELLARIDVVEDTTQHPRGLLHMPLTWGANYADDATQRFATLPPFLSARGSWNREWLVDAGGRDSTEVAAALYLLPEGCEPVWFQVCLDVYKRRWPETVRPTVTRLHGVRPTVRLRKPKEVP